nr:large terminase protein [Caudoviricetes sp.]
MNFNFDFGFNFNMGFGEERVDNFKSFCKSVSYPQPFEKQIEMRDFMFSGNLPRMVLGARGYGKTDYGTILGSAYELEKNNNLEILLITKEQDRGREIAEEIRKILVLRGAKMQGKAKSTVRFKGKKGKEPNLKSLTVRSRGIRGRHPDLIIMEDPITPDDTSPAERKRVKAVYEELYKLTPNIVIIGQPVHKADLYQELRYIIPTFEMIWGDIPELDDDLEAQRGAGISEASIQASYFLNIVDADTLPFHTAEVVEYSAQENIAFIDPAREGKDYTAISVAGRSFDNLVVSGFAFRKAWYDCLDEFKQIFTKLKVNRVMIETNGIGEMAVIQMRQLGIPTVGRNTTSNKHGRIMNLGAYVRNIKLAKMKGMTADLLRANEIFIDQVKNYEYNVEHDDAPDSMAGAAIFMGVLSDGNV